MHLLFDARICLLVSWESEGGSQGVTHNKQQRLDNQKKIYSLGSQRMRGDFYPTDSLEVFSKQDSMTKKDLWSKCTATTQEKLSYH